MRRWLHPSIAPKPAVRRDTLTHACSGEEYRQSLDEPERSHRSNRIGGYRQRALFDCRRQINAPGDRQYGEDGGDEHELTGFDASTPALKLNNARGVSACGRPISVSALQKPKPCSRPKVKATSHGFCAAKLGSPRTISQASRMMLSAIVASTGGPGTCTTPRVVDKWRSRS